MKITLKNVEKSGENTLFCCEIQDYDGDIFEMKLTPEMYKEYIFRADEFAEVNGLSLPSISKKEPVINLIQQGIENIIQNQSIIHFSDFNKEY